MIVSCHDTIVLHHNTTDFPQSFNLAVLLSSHPLFWVECGTLLTQLELQRYLAVGIGADLAECLARGYL